MISKQEDTCIRSLGMNRFCSCGLRGLRDFSQEQRIVMPTSFHFGAKVSTQGEKSFLSVHSGGEEFFVGPFRRVFCRSGARCKERSFIPHHNRSLSGSSGSSIEKNCRASIAVKLQGE